MPHPRGDAGALRRTRAVARGTIMFVN